VELNDNYCTVGYADDTGILINEKFPETLSEVLHTALGIVQQWCHKTNLSINPKKTVIVPFTKKRDIRKLKEQIPCNKTIQLPSETKHHELMLEKALTWMK
jgi:hypothetical protein